ncbi:potassium channel-like protein [Plenodomus tracheiphilus IPT5]|uniref:Potassium channel-like protein n=1 Tax=Plenodomus tracheiphilus IPT5 TaxID=1408161 RepID=A0A6A7B1V3_9PLEO|nr:potassium channel-like protein [Plenodomus tracheiphilus IPT5]
MTSVNHDTTSPSPSVDSPMQCTTPETLTSKKKRWWDVWERWKEGEETDWWFASTGIPLLAATLGPLANVSSIAALVTSWRQTNYVDGQWLSDFEGVAYADPRWCYWINVVSLICGFLGNIFLLLNFTQRVRYIIALPATIILWYLSSGFLIAITVCMNVYTPPNRPIEGYTQGFWYAIAAATFYTVCSMVLMVNMLGYFLGHYGQDFKLSDSQRTLILQTMAFFIWLAGGSAVFSKLESDNGQVWAFSDALYFCDVTILTVGFGDLVPTSDVSRGIVFPYSVFGIIMLALIVSSLYKAVRELGEEKVVQKHVDRLRTRVVERTVTNSFDLRHREREAHHLIRRRARAHPKISAPMQLRPYRTVLQDREIAVQSQKQENRATFPDMPTLLNRPRTPKLLLLKAEKDRFEAMRLIQASSSQFKRWFALFWSISTFSILWCIGAIVFWQCEKHTLDLTYFRALYFCYISLLTIGYGDLAPKSNAGRCFFVLWSLIAVPSVTILVGDLGDTVVAKFKGGWDGFADWAILPREGIYRAFLNRHPRLLQWLQHRIDSHATRKRMKHGFETTDPDSPSPTNNPQDIEANNTDPDLDPESTNSDLNLIHPPTIETLAVEAEQDTSTTPTHASLAHRLALTIQTVAHDLRIPKKSYSYEEWVEFTRLIRLTTRHYRHGGDGEGDGEEEEEEEGLVDWDWIGEDSPMMSGMGESEWLLRRLCESLVRLERKGEEVVDGRGGEQGAKT